MPRMGRVVLPNYPHHVVQRGHNRQVVFAAEEDYQRYVSDLKELKDAFEKFGHSLVVASGNKSGLMLIQLPIESRAPGHGISIRWLIDNWSKWVYPECDVNDVFLYERSAASSWVSTA